MRFAAGVLLLACGVADAAADPRALAQACLAQAEPLERAALAQHQDPPPLAEAGEACQRFLDAFRRDTEWGGGDAPAGSEALRDVMAGIDDFAVREPPAALDLASLGAILDEIRAPPPQADQSWWQRFKRWLFQRLDEDGRAPRWLDELAHIPEDVVRLIWWSAFTLLVGALAFVVVAELRAAGVFDSRRRRAGRAAARVAQGSARGHAPDLAHIAGLGLRDQPAALLLWAIARLRQRGQLPGDDSLTNRQLLRQLRSVPQAPLDWFGGVVALAEAQVYGGREADGKALGALLLQAGQIDQGGA